MPKTPTCTCGTCQKCRHREYMRNWLRTPKGRAHNHRNYAQWRARPSDATRAVNRRSVAHRRATPSFIKQAQGAVQKAIRHGDLTRPDHCERCKADAKPEAHHADYSKPLDVEWLCRSCHRLEHSPY